MFATHETGFSPLSGIDTRFKSYVARRKADEQLHMQGGVPDYAFALDYELRKKLAHIPHFESICRKITETIVARQIQMLNQQALAISATQLPEIYQMGADCAHRLGIGIPNIFMVNSPEINAYTIAMDDVSPMIVLYSGLVERLTPGELKCVIAHECGHIHNYHGMYKTVIDVLLSGASSVLGSLVLSAANLALMQFWTRAGEITADRAAMICADRIEDAISVNAKLLYGATINKDFDINIDALRQQLDITMDNPTRIQEILSDHPSSIRRIFCDKEFEDCEVFYAWRPELKKPDSVMHTKEEVDRRCQKLINILDNK